MATALANLNISFPTHFDVNDFLNTTAALMSCTVERLFLEIRQKPKVETCFAVLSCYFSKYGKNRGSKIFGFEWDQNVRRGGGQKMSQINVSENGLETHNVQ